MSTHDSTVDGPLWLDALRAFALYFFGGFALLCTVLAFVVDADLGFVALALLLGFHVVRTAP